VVLKAIRCPLCRCPTTWEGNPHRPFCSQRCRLADLGNWAMERYRVPGPPAEDAAAADDEHEDEE